MSIFNDLLPKIIEIPKKYIKNGNDELEAALKNLQKLEDEYFRTKTRAPDKSLMTTLQSIDEDDDETTKSPETLSTNTTENATVAPQPQAKRSSMKRGKDQVDGITSPAIDKKQKRNASVKAQTIISAQAKANIIFKERNTNEIINIDDVETNSKVVNVNLSQKLRRESPDARKRKDETRTQPAPAIKIKQEKISLPPPAAAPLPEPNMKLERISTVTAAQDIMPPPAALPKRGRAARPRSSQAESADESTRRSNRIRKPKDMDFPPPVSTRSSRASSRSKAAEETNSVGTTSDAECMPPPDARPKRTRAKKKLSESSNPDAEKENTPANVIASPNDKPRPKRTRRAQKAAEKEAELKKPSPEKPKEIIVSPKEERISEPQPKLPSPVLRIEKMTDKREKEKTQKQNSVEEVNSEKQKLQKQNSQEKVDKKLRHQNSVEEVTDLVNKKIQKQNSKEKSKTLQKQNSVEEFIDLEKQISKEQDKKLQKQNTDLEKRLQKESNDKKRLEKQITESDIHSKKKKDMELKQKLHKQNSDLGKQETKLQKQNSDLGKQETKLQKQNSDLGKQNANLQKPNSQEKSTNKVNNNNEEFKMTDDHMRLNETITLQPLDSTIVLTNGVYNHAPVTPQNIRAADATVTVDRDTMVLAHVNDATVVLSAEIEHNMTADASLLTDDDSPLKDATPEKISPPQPTSAVKQKVQQFEQLAARTTRTKTRQQQSQQEASHTPPNAPTVPSAGIAADTLSKMNNMIFNGKVPTTSNSAIKHRAIVAPKSRTASASKASALSRQHEESVALKEDARKKKEAMLEAKREQQRKKREEKIAAAAAAREVAERERQLAMEAAARERQEKQAHVDQGKLERLKEVERWAEEAILQSNPATPSRTPPRPVPATYMQDGFQYLDSDEDHSPKPRPLPDWALSKTRKVLLAIQAELPPSLPSTLFTMKVHSPDLREIFPSIPRSRLIRTSSAVWRTPPSIDPVLISRLEQAEA